MDDRTESPDEDRGFDGCGEQRQAQAGQYYQNQGQDATGPGQGQIDETLGKRHRDDRGERWQPRPARPPPTISGWRRDHLLAVDGQGGEEYRRDRHDKPKEQECRARRSAGGRGNHKHQ